MRIDSAHPPARNAARDWCRGSARSACSPSWIGRRCMTDYLRDGAAIYQQSFAIIRAEADLSRFSDAEADVAVRMLHSCGMVEIAKNIVFADEVITAAREALHAGAAILCDSEMVSHG